jgi:hypothetical protein
MSPNPKTDEVGQRRPEWKQLDHLVIGARKRGWTEEDLAFFMSSLGITWAKATFAAEAKAAALASARARECTGHLVHDEFTRCPVHDK